MLNFKSQSPWKYAMFALVFCLLFSAIFYPVIGRAASENVVSSGNQTVLQPRTISVTGSADVMVTPDEVDITVGIETRNANFNTAKKENDENSKKVIALAKKYGIDAKQVQSDYIRSYPVYEKYYEASKVSYYMVQKRIVIKLRDIDKFETLASDLMGNGTILIQNIEFISTDLWKYKNEARKLAINAAKDKAKLLTSELGNGIGKPITINEEQFQNWSWYGAWSWGSSWYGYSQPNASMLSNVVVNSENPSSGSFGSDSDGATNGTVSVGQIRVTARIGVIFELN